MNNRHLSKSYVILTITIIILIFGSIVLTRIFYNYNQKVRELNFNYHPSIKNISLLKEKYYDIKKLISLMELSEYKQPSFFQKEFDKLYEEWIFPLTGDLKIHSEKWEDADVEPIKELINTLRIDFYNNISELFMQYNELDSQREPESKEILLLYSKIEQGFDYLINKRNDKINTLYLESETLFNNFKTRAKIFILILIIIISVTVVGQNYYINKSLKLAEMFIHNLSVGIIPEKMIIKRKERFGVIYKSLNDLIIYFQNKLNHIEKIIQKDYSTTPNFLNESDKIGLALHTLQNKLLITEEEEEKRKKYEAERNWLNEGVTRINDILQTSGDNINELSYLLIKEIVEYTDSKLGALYILNDEDQNDTFIEMVSVYAYDRRKHLSKKIYIGEGLVGRCVQENDIIYMTDIPDNYLSIKSGMGETKPVSLLIIPLKLPDDSVYGAVELASTEKMEQFEIEYIQTSGESIASAVAKMKINLKTHKLLEHSRQQADELSEQKEQMRKNVNELKIIQEQYKLREELLNKEILELKAKLKKE